MDPKVAKIIEAVIVIIGNVEGDTGDAFLDGQLWYAKEALESVIAEDQQAIETFYTEIVDNEY